MRKYFQEITSHDYEQSYESKDQQETIEDTEKVILMTHEKGTKEKDFRQIWIGDTGSTCHMTNSKEVLINVQSISSSVIFGNGECLKATHIGDKKGLVRQKDGSEKTIVFTKVKYVFGI